MFEKYPQYEHLLAQVQLFCLMLGTGATLSPGDFWRILRRPKYLLVGAVAQYLVTPLVAVVLSRLFGAAPGITVGLILVAAMPGGTLSKVFTLAAKGNVALSITLTAVGTLASVVTVPLLLRVLAAEQIPADFRMPVSGMVLELVRYLLLPLIAGMLVSRYAHRHRQTFARWCIRAGFLLVVVVIVGALGSGRIRPGEHGMQIAMLIILFGLLSQQFSMLPFRLSGWPNPDCVAVGMEVTMRNLNLALLLKALLFPAAAQGDDPLADGVLFVILFYAGVAMVLALALVLNFRRMHRNELRKQSQATG
jgi:BASS family bile acid:Na+ symporter